MTFTSSDRSRRNSVPDPEGNRFASRRGSALVATLFVVVAVSVLAVAYLQLSLSKNREGRSSVDAKAAFYMAEAGISEAFMAIRMGRSGNVGAAEEPASFANGVFWVEAEARPDGTCHLRSTGLCGVGRSSLEVVVDRTESSIQSLGVFGDSEVTVGEGAVVDSYDSRVGEYDDQGYDPAWYEEEAARRAAAAQGASSQGAGGGALLGLAEPASPLSAPGEGWVGGARTGAALGGPAQLPNLGDLVPVVLRTSEAVDFDLDEWAGVVHEIEDVERLPRSAKLTSNGDVSILGTPSGELPTRVLGSIRPGPEGTVTAEAGSFVTGATTPAEERVPGLDVRPPTLAERGDLLVAGTASLENTKGSWGVVQAPSGTTLVLEGPLTMVVEELWIEPGATLRVDTTAGPVELYATSYLGLLDGSTVESVGDAPNDATFVVTAETWEDRDADGTLDSPAELDATGELRAVVYAPHAALAIDADLRFLGSLAADRVEIGPGAHVSFDVALESVALGPLVMPALGAWRLVDLPDEPIVRSRVDPVLYLRAQGVTPPPAADAYRDSMLQITFRCAEGHMHTYEGPEHLFDRSIVDTTVSELNVVAPVSGRLSAPVVDDYLQPTFGHAASDALSPFTNLLP